MEERGIIVKVTGRKALIKAARTGACENCASKKSCASTNQDETCIEAVNDVGAGVGDSVIFTAGEISVMKAGVLLYIVPVLSFIAGVVLGKIVADNFLPGANADLLTGITGVVFLAFAFLALKLYNRKIEKNDAVQVRIIRVV